MSVTLGGKRKKQIIVADPRNKRWTEDDSKLGSKLLKKMGWKEGNGLGAREQGMSSSSALKMNATSDTRGLGLDKETFEAWEAGGKEFDSLLASLNACDEDVDVESAKKKKKQKVEHCNLQKLSESSSSRIHYHKKVKGKDVSKYSDQDLDSILGRRQNKNLSEEKVVDEKEAKNMNDYFSTKMLEKLKKHNFSSS